MGQHSFIWITKKIELGWIIVLYLLRVMYNGNDVESGSFIEIDLILASPPGYFVCICCMRDSTFSLSFSCGMPV